MTIRELFREFAAARLRAQDDYRRDVTLAWNIVRIYVVSKAKQRLMPLKDLVADIGASDRPQSGMQLRTALAVLSQQYGIPLRKAKGN